MYCVSSSSCWLFVCSYHRAILAQAYRLLFFPPSTLVGGCPPFLWACLVSNFGRVTSCRTLAEESSCCSLAEGLLIQQPRQRLNFQTSECLWIGSSRLQGTAPTAPP